MQKNFIAIWVIFTILLSCNPTTSSRDVQMEEWKSEVMNTELAFAKMAQSDGITEAFLAFAAEDAVLMRNNQLIRGKNAIEEMLASQKSENIKLSWKPDFIEVSTSGDLAYTYGQFLYTLIDSLGKEQHQNGVFHTVWKRQTDGSWKYVWD